MGLSRTYPQLRFYPQIEYGLPEGQAQPRAQPRPDGRDGFGAVGGFGDLGEQPIHQAPVGALPGLQPLGHLDAKLVAHQVRV
ncbi:hypothetical protein A5705_25025 [Mycobacterium sp. E787]|nr:hypothetical protein A5705_25025 [Mycobacterium sp. E787]